MKKKKVILSAGGTGGHLFPAQAVAQSLDECDLLFVAGGLGTNRFFDRNQFLYEEIHAATFSFLKPLHALRSSKKIFKGVRQARQIIHTFAPDVVVGFGSFYTLPVLAAALLDKIPLVLHEQNAVPGRVNRFFSRFAHTTAITFPDSARYFRRKTTPVCFPLLSTKHVDGWEYFELEKGKPVLLVFGGSQGARRLDELILGALPHLSSYQILHFTNYDTETVKNRYQECRIRHCVKSFEPHLLAAMEIADLAITRSGAATLAELTKTKTPAILIPFPYATNNHQEKNAQHFAGGEIYLERNLTSESLAQAIIHFPIEEKKAQMQAETHASTLTHFADIIRNIIKHG